MRRHSVAEYLENFLRRGWDTAYISRRGYRTFRSAYRDIADAAFQFGRELEQRYIEKGDCVVLWGPNCAEWVAAFFGCALRGVVVVPIDDVAAPDFAERVQQQVDAKLLVSSGQRQLGSVPILPLERLFEAISQHRALPYSPIEMSDQDPLEIVFTSGTTAEPKGVVITHANVLANIAPLEIEIRKYLRYERMVHPVRFLNLLPLSHVFGQFLGMFLPQLLRGSVIFQENLSPADVISTIRRERVSVLVAVPRMLQSLKEKIERDLKQEGQWDDFQHRFTSSQGRHFLRRWWIFRNIRRRFGWKFWAFICGGATLDGVTEEFWDRLGYAVVQGYGLTETTSLISVNHPFHLGKGSVGKVLGGREVKLAEDGEILVRGGGVASGYWSGGELRPVADEGWYHTGDIGELDSDGNLYFKSRKKDVMVTPAGMNVYPEDLESALRRQPQIKDTVVVPLARDGNAEPCAVLILRDDSDPEAVIQQANNLLAEYQRIHCWFVWPEDDFPRTSTQKPRVKVIVDAVQKHFAGDHGAAVHGSPLAELIQRVTGRTPSQLSSGSNLEADLNLSSLDRVALLSAVEDRYQVDLSDTRFSSINTVGDLERALHGEVPPRKRYHYPRWVQRWPVTWIRFLTNHLLLLPAVFILGWPRIEGRENLRDVNGPVLVICNHIGDVDPGFVIAALPERLRNKLAVATGGETLESYRTPPPERNTSGRIYDRVKWTLGVSLLNLFPLPREAGFRESFAYVGESVDRGYSVLVFPEGRHTTTGKLQRFRGGIGLLTNSLRIPIVPMRIDGLFEIKQAGRKFAAPGTIRVKIGSPVEFSSDENPQRIAEELEKRVAEL